MTPSPSGSALGWALSQEKARSVSQSGRTSASSEGLVTRASALGLSVEQASQQGVDHRRGRLLRCLCGDAAGVDRQHKGERRTSGPGHRLRTHRGVVEAAGGEQGLGVVRGEWAKAQLGDEVLPAAGEPAGAGRPP